MARMAGEEADRLAALAVRGDEAARNLLAAEFWPAVRGLTLKHKKKFSAISYDEAISAGATGLYDAIRTFDPSKGEPFSKWVAWKIYYAILSEVRRACKRAKRCEVVEPGDLDGMVADIQEPSSPWFGPEDHERIHAVLDRWDRTIQYQRLSLFVKLISGLDPRGPLGYPQIGEIMHLDREQVRQIADRAYFMLCREFGVQSYEGLSLSEATKQA